MALTIDQIQVAEKYLWRFGNPECYILKSDKEPGGPTPDWLRYASKFNSKKFWLEEVFTVNDKFPLGMHFTPNGNFADNNVQTGRLIQRKTWYEWAKPYWRAMVADFDRKDCEAYESESDEKYYDYLIKNYIDIEWMPTPDYLHETPGWFHFVWIIKEKESRRMHKFLSDKDISNAMFFIQASGYWWVSIWSKQWRWRLHTVTGIDVWKQRFLTSASIRMPGSQYRKPGSPHEVKLFQFFRDKLVLYKKQIIHSKDLNPSLESNEITFELIKSWSVKYNEVTKSEKVLEKVIVKNSWFDQRVFEAIDKLPMPDVLNALAWMRMSYWWRHCSMRYEAFSKSIILDYEDWETHKPSWYKYREEANMVREFNWVRTIDERPQWKPSRFLYYFFNRNWKFVDEFIHDKFWIKLIVWEDDELWVLRHATVWENDIICLPTKIILKKLVTLQNGTTTPKVTDLFQQPFTVIWKWMTSFSAAQWETEDTEQVFIIKKYNSDERILLRCYPTKRLWNQDNIWKWLFFYWDDNDLWLFYDAIFNDWSIPNYEIVGRNWYFDWYYVFWWEVFPVESHDPVFNVCKSKWFKFDIQKWMDVTIGEYARMWKKIWDEKIFMPTLLQSIALAWVDIWNRLENFNQFPWLLLTWYTWSWKTVLHETMSLAMWYAKKSRTLSISRTSPQPLKQAGIDWSILHLEEFTDPIRLSSEDILRDILNRSISSKGTPSKNVVWKYRSSPFVDWESMPQSESVANRFVIIPVDKRYWKWDTNSINDIQKYVITKELYPKRYEIWKDIKQLEETLIKWVNYLTKNNVNPRTANVWAPLFTVNELFNVWYNVKTLLKNSLELMKDVGITHWDEQRITPFMRLRIFIAESVMERKISISETSYGKHSQISIIFQKEYATKNISTISKIINEINQKTMDWYQEWWRDLTEFKPLTFMSPMLILNINEVNVSPTDTALNDLREKYIKLLPKSVYSYYGTDF